MDSKQSDYAKILKKNQNVYEVRCWCCGKRLFDLKGENARNFIQDVAKRKNDVIIVARCTRSECKKDNLVSF